MTSAEDTRRENFKAFLKRRGILATDLAKRAGLPRTTIYSYTSGQTAQMLSATAERIALALGVTVQHMFSAPGDAEPIGTVPVLGVLGVQGQVSEHAPEGVYEIGLPAFLDPGAPYVAYELDALAPMLAPMAEPGWLVVFAKTDDAPRDQLGKACLAELADGRRFFRRLRPSVRGLSFFNLESWNGSPAVEGVKVVRAYPLAALMPHPHPRVGGDGKPRPRR